MVILVRVMQVWAWHLQLVEVIEDPLFFRHPAGAQEFIRDMPERISEEHATRGLLPPRLRRQAWPCFVLRQRLEPAEI